MQNRAAAAGKGATSRNAAAPSSLACSLLWGARYLHNALLHASGIGGAVAAGTPAAPSATGRLAPVVTAGAAKVRGCARTMPPLARWASLRRERAGLASSGLLPEPPRCGRRDEIACGRQDAHQRLGIAPESPILPQRGRRYPAASPGLARPFFAPDSGAGLVSAHRSRWSLPAAKEIPPSERCELLPTSRKSGLSRPHPRVILETHRVFPNLRRHPTPCCLRQGLPERPRPPGNAHEARHDCDRIGRLKSPPMRPRNAPRGCRCARPI